jgi:hypothetical protein
MKPSIKLFTVFLTFSVILSIPAFGQKDFDNITPYKGFSGYTDPCENDFAPASVPISDAFEEATLNAAAAGFSSAFFTPLDITELVNQKDCIGIRLYNALESSTSSTSVIIAVGVKSDGSEINPALKKSYLQSQPAEAQGINSKLISSGTANNYVTNIVSSGKFSAVSVFFPKSTITEIASSTNCAGVKVIPGSRKFQLSATDPNEVGSYLCLMLAAVNQSYSETESSYLKSLEPCPTICPNDNLILGPKK